jgi:hypothetical protein
MPQLFQTFMHLNLGQHTVSTEIIQTPDGKPICIPRYEFLFSTWTKSNDFDTYNGKTILEFKGEPLFAELFILRLLEEQGYKGVWVDTYRNKFWTKLPSLSLPVSLDNKLKEIYDSIYLQKGGRRVGCFDVIAYKSNKFLFAELKRKSKDSIRATQIEWLSAAFRAGLKPSSFIIAEWDIG